MKSRIFLAIMACMMLSTQVQAGKLIYHPEYSPKVGSAIDAYLKMGDLVYNPGRAIASFFGKENWFIDNSPFRAYAQSDRSEAAKKQIDSELEKPEEAYHTVSGEIQRDELLKVHSKGHVKGLFKDPRVVANIFEMGFFAEKPLNWSYTSEFFRNKILRPFLLQAQGTLEAVDQVLDGKKGFGWAINLGGGFHHAKSGPESEKIEDRLQEYVDWGNCTVSDQGLAILRAYQKYNKKNILLVDLDAHQGNGNACILKQLREKYPDLNAHTFDMYNSESSGNYPPDQEEAGEHIKYKHALKRWVTGKVYLDTLRENLPKAVEEMNPDLIVYNAGTDLLEGDSEGLMSLSEEEMIERDQFVFETAKNNDTPIISNTSGGYTTKSAGLIANSIKNLLKKGIIGFGKKQ